MILFSTPAASLPLFEFSGSELHTVSLPPLPQLPISCFTALILCQYLSVFPDSSPVAGCDATSYSLSQAYFSVFQGLSFCVLVGWVDWLVGLVLPQAEFCCYCYGPYPALFLTYTPFPSMIYGF